MCVRRGGPIARVVSAGVSHERGGGQHLEDVLEEAILAELPTLERGLATLAVFAAVAPLLGLLGADGDLADGDEDHQQPGWPWCQFDLHGHAPFLPDTRTLGPAHAPTKRKLSACEPCVNQ